MTSSPKLTDSPYREPDQEITKFLDWNWVNQYTQSSEEGIGNLLLKYQELLVSDSNAEARTAVQYLYDALSSSYPILKEYPEQLPTQLYSRLVHLKSEVPLLAALIEELEKYRQLPWLFPMGGLNSSHSPLRVTLKTCDASCYSLSFASQAHQLIWVDQNNDLNLWDLDNHNLLAKISGIESKITALIISPDGKTAVSGSVNGFLYLWDLDNHNLVSLVKAHQWAITDLKLSKDQDYLISSSADLTVKIWQISSEELQWQKTLNGHQSQVISLELISDMSLIISVDASGSVKLWDVHQGKLIGDLTSGPEAVVAITSSYDNHLATVTDNGLIQIWDLNQKKIIRTLTLGDQAIICLSFSADNKKLAVSTEEDQLLVWSLNSGNLDSIINTNNLVEKIIPYNSQKNEFILASDCRLELWNLSNCITSKIRETVHKLQLNFSGAIAISNSSNSNGHNLKVWDSNQGELISDWPQPSRVTQFLLTPACDKMVAIAINGKLSIFDLVEGKVALEDSGYSNSRGSLCLSRDGLSALTALADKRLKLWDLDQLEEVKTLPGHPESDFPVLVALGQDGDQAVSATQDRLKIWDLKTGEALHSLTIKTIHKLLLTPKADQAIASNQSKLVIFDLQSLLPRLTLNWPASPVISVEFDLEGTLALVLHQDYTIRLWDLINQSQLFYLSNPPDSIIQVTLSSNGEYILALTRSGTLKLFHRSSPKPLATLTQDTQITTAAISGNGKIIATADTVGVVKFWQLKP